jgi:hypothetical protein
VGSCCSRRGGEHTTLTDALLNGVAAPTMVALLHSRTDRHVNLVAALMCGRRMSKVPGAKASLGGSRVLSALLDALLAAEAPAMRAIADAGGGSASGGPAAAALDNLVCALSEALNTWPRTAERLAAAPQCDAVLRCLARLHKPLGRRADADGSLAQIHSSATTVLQSLTCSARGATLLWTGTQDTVRALVASLAAQVRRARLRDTRASALMRFCAARRARWRAHAPSPRCTSPTRPPAPAPSSATASFASSVAGRGR